MSLERLQADAKGFPVNADGHIVSPLYIPRNSAYGRAIAEYCERTPPCLWPKWLAADLKIMVHRK